MGGATEVGTKVLTGDALAAHLQMIQGVIGRMGQNAFSTKTWAVTVMGAALALGRTSVTASWEAAAVVLPLSMFWVMDAYFMRQEHLFRRLFEAAARGEVPAFSMNTGPHASGVMGMFPYLFAHGVWPVHAITVFAVAAKAVWG